MSCAYRLLEPEFEITPGCRRVTVDANSGKVALDTPKADAGPRAPEANGSNAGPSVEDRLQKLENLKKKGLVSPQEYKDKKAEIMKDL